MRNAIQGNDLNMRMYCVFWLLNYGNNCCLKEKWYQKFPREKKIGNLLALFVFTNKVGHTTTPRVFHRPQYPSTPCFPQSPGTRSHVTHWPWDLPWSCYNNLCQFTAIEHRRFTSTRICIHCMDRKKDLVTWTSPIFGVCMQDKTKAYRTW